MVAAAPSAACAAPGRAATLRQQARRLAATRRMGEAASLLRQAVDLDPGHVETMVSLAWCLHGSDDRDEAEAWYRHALAAAPGHRNARINLATLLLGRDRADEAVEVLAAGSRHGADAALSYNLGYALQRLGRLAEAAAAYRDAIAAQPDHASAHNNLGNVLWEMGRPEEARQAYEEVLRLDPRHANARHNLGNIHYGAGRIGEALSAYRQAIAGDPNFAEAHNSLGAALYKTGCVSEAAACFARAVALKPDLAEARRHLQASRQALAEAEIAALARQWDRTDLAVEERSAAGLAFARRCAALGRQEQAMTAAKAANALARSRLIERGEGFDRAGFAAQVDRIIATVGRSQGAPPGSLSEQPVFIVGMPCSGATLVEQVLAGQRGVQAVGAAPNAAPWLAAVEHPADVTGQRSRELADGWLARCAEPQAARIVERMPDNVLHVGLILAVFPHARIIQCRRNALDTVLSCFFRHFSHGHAFATDLGDCASRALGVRRLCDHWTRVAPEAVLDVHFEDMVADFEAQARRLLGFLDLPWNSAAVTSVTPPPPGHIGGWVPYRRHLGPVLDALAGTDALVEALAT